MEWGPNHILSSFPLAPYYPGMPAPYYIRPPVLAPVDDKWVPHQGLAPRRELADHAPFVGAELPRADFPRPTFAPPEMRPDVRPEFLPEARLGSAKRTRGPAAPRKRSATACDHCRHKKIKCDNVKPKCGACFRNGHECIYRAFGCAPAPPDSYDAILTRLDLIAAHLRLPRPAPPRPAPQQWDMSLTHMLRWQFLRTTLGLSSDDVAHDTHRLLAAYERNNLQSGKRTLQAVRSHMATDIETVVAGALPGLVNSFLLNCHTKVPCVDTVNLFEAVLAYTVMAKADPNTRIWSILEQASEVVPGEVLDAYAAALKQLGIENNALRRRAFQRFCESVPLILVICALGLLSTQVRCDNFCEYALLIEERRSMRYAPTVELPAGLPADRMELALAMVRHANVIQYMFPACMEQVPLVVVQYRILLSQFYLCTMNPLDAHRQIVAASSRMVYYLEKDRVRPRSRANPTPEEAPTVERLFWTCLKLECELQSELSPYVKSSGITNVAAPLLFLKVPLPPSKGANLPECVQMAANYDDKHLWLFFLTEIAVRKLDNQLFDQLYPHVAEGLLWDLEHFASTEVWQLVIKYLDQYNGIIGSLLPEIRSFVMLEEDPNRMIARIKQAEKKWQGKSDVLEAEPQFGLDEFAVDSNTLLQMHSESVMFIKTRILTSKLALFRPFVYLLLEDKIPLHDLVDAALTVQKEESAAESADDYSATDSSLGKFSMGHSSLGRSSIATSSQSSAAASNFFPDMIPGYPPTNAYQQRFPDEDFSHLVEYGDENDNDEGLPIVLDMATARKQLLRVIVRNIVLLPKLGVQAIWLHRHAGSWYYIRNFFFGVTVQFLLYKKVQAMLAASEGARPVLPEEVSILSSIFNRESAQKSLELALLMTNYWKDELSDCIILSEYLQMCLDKI